MKIIADRNLNLHSESTPGGLIHVPGRLGVNVPEDVTEHPAFDNLVKHGVIAVIDGRLSKRAMQLSKPAEAKVSPAAKENEASVIPVASSLDDEEEDEEEVEKPVPAKKK